MNSAKKDQLYRFTAVLEAFRLNLKAACKVSVVWKRGDTVVEMRNKRDFDAGAAKLDQELSLDCLVAYDTISKQFLQAKSTMSVYIHTDRGTRQAGEVQIDLSELLNKRLEELSYNSFLLKCPDTTSTLSFKLRAKPQKDDAKRQAQTRSEIIRQPPKDQQPEQVSSGKSFIAPRIMIKPSPEDGSALETDNKKLQEELKAIKKENERMRNLIEKNGQCSQQFRVLIDKMNKQKEQLSLLNKNASLMEERKEQLEQELLKGRIKLATIFNMASEIGGSSLIDQLQLAGGFLESSPTK